MDLWQRRLYDAYVSTGQSHAAAAPNNAADPYLDRLIRRHFDLPRDRRILDLACGDGRLVQRLLAHGYTQVEGLDISAEQIAAARRAGLTQVHCQELTEFLAGCPHARYDAIFLMDVLEHLDSPTVLAVLDGVHRILAPAGRLVLHVPNAAGLFGMRTRYGDFTHLQAFTPQSLRQVLGACGFDGVSCFEDTPVVHGIVSGLRWLLWQTLTSVPRLLLAAETGVTRHILSQNLLATALKR